MEHSQSSMPVAYGVVQIFEELAELVVMLGLLLWSVLHVDWPGSRSLTVSPGAYGPERLDLAVIVEFLALFLCIEGTCVFCRGISRLEEWPGHRQQSLTTAAKQMLYWASSYAFWRRIVPVQKCKVLRLTRCRALSEQSLDSFHCIHGLRVTWRGCNVFKSPLLSKSGELSWVKLGPIVWHHYIWYTISREHGF